MGQSQGLAAQSLEREAGAGEPAAPLADEFEHVLAHWAVGGLWAKGGMRGTPRAVVGPPAPGVTRAAQGLYWPSGQPYLWHPTPSPCPLGLSPSLTLMAMRNLFQLSLLAAFPGRLNSILFLRMG